MPNDAQRWRKLSSPVGKYRCEAPGGRIRSKHAFRNHSRETIMGECSCIYCEYGGEMADAALDSQDAERGMAWWNGLTEAERAEWMERAGNTGVAADAWEAYKNYDPTPADDGRAWPQADNE